MLILEIGLALWCSLMAIVIWWFARKEIKENKDLIESLNVYLEELKKACGRENVNT